MVNQICKPDPDNPLLCDDFDVPPTYADFDPTVTSDGETRISRKVDFVFINDPSDEHAITLDFSRPRRTRLERRRGAPKKDEVFTLSDHAGITFTLLIAPK